jgi:hypothetical protein
MTSGRLDDAGGQVAATARQVKYFAAVADLVPDRR